MGRSRARSYPCPRAQALLACAAIAGLVASSGAARGEAPWQEIRDEEGIKVWKRPGDAGSILEFKSEALVDAPAVRIAAAVREFDRHSEWMEGCTSSQTLRFPAAFTAVGYQRFDSKIPFVSDRDVVIAGAGKFEPDCKTIRIDFASVDDARFPPRAGVVRMPRLSGHFELAPVDAEHTRVEYQVYADPGGALPRWAVNFIFAEVPFKTIAKLRKQVAKPGYEAGIAVIEASQALAAEPGASAPAPSAP